MVDYTGTRIVIRASVFRGQRPLKLGDIIMKLCQFVELKGLSLIHRVEFE